MKFLSRQYLVDLLRTHRTQREAAAAAGVRSASICRYIKRYGIARPRAEMKTKAGNDAWKGARAMIQDLAIQLTMPTGK